MKRRQAFVRVGIPHKENIVWVNADILDLDDESFRLFTLDMLCRSGIVVHIKSNAVEGEELKYRVRPDLEEKYIKEKLGEDD